MPETFTPITTQADFDKAAAPLLEAERAKYADYDNLKAQAGKDGETIKALQAEVAGYKHRDAQAKAAASAGLPAELAGRLSGDTDEALLADAKALAKLITKNTPPPPLHTNEPAGKDNGRAALRALASQLTNL